MAASTPSTTRASSAATARSRPASVRGVSSGGNGERTNSAGSSPGAGRPMPTLRRQNSSVSRAVRIERRPLWPPDPPFRLIRRRPSSRSRSSWMTTKSRGESVNSSSKALTAGPVSFIQVSGRLIAPQPSRRAPSRIARARPARGLPTIELLRAPGRGLRYCDGCGRSARQGCRVLQSSARLFLSVLLGLLLLRLGCLLLRLGIFLVSLGLLGVFLLSLGFDGCSAFLVHRSDFLAFLVQRFAFYHFLLALPYDC